MAINNVVLTGRLTKDPEIRYTQSGKAVASISLAVGRKFKRDEIDFFECIAWNVRARQIQILCILLPLGAGNIVTAGYCALCARMFT